MRTETTPGHPPSADSAEAPNDRVLVQRILAGDLKWFEVIMRRYNRRLFRIARSILRRESEAEDVVQEAYVRAYLKLSEFRGPGGFAAWLTRITVNEALARRRRADYATASLADEDLEAWGHEEDAMFRFNPPVRPPEEIAGNEELRRVLEREIDALPDAFRVAFVMREVEQLSVREAAALLDVEPATVKTRVHRAKKLLQLALQKEIGTVTRETYPFAGQRCDRIVDRVFRRIASLSGQQGGSGDHH